MKIRTEIRALIDAGDVLFAVNHSGGKDSHAMFIEMLREIPKENLAVFHASLGEFEWEGALELAREHAERAGVPFIVCRAVDKDGNKKDLFDLVDRRFANRPEVPSWPSRNNRTCTSELKTGPIEREIRHYMKERGLKRVVNCLGLRAAESDERAKRMPFEKREGKNDGLAKAGREAWNWLPIFELTTKEVFKIIADAGDKPLWVYENGNERASCKFCIFACNNDLLNAALADPKLYERYLAKEKEVGYPMHAFRRKPLNELIEDAKAEAAGGGDLFGRRAA